MKRMLVLALLLACEGPIGPAGDDGVDGKDGVANISVIKFSVLASQWEEITPENFWYYKAIPEITAAVLNSGAVMVQLENGDGEWWGLPQTYSTDIDNDLVLEFSSLYTYIYEQGGLWVYVEFSFPIGTPLGQNYKAIIIPPV